MNTEFESSQQQDFNNSTVEPIDKTIEKRVNVKLLKKREAVMLNQKRWLLQRNERQCH